MNARESEILTAHLAAIEESRIAIRHQAEASAFHMLGRAMTTARINLTKLANNSTGPALGRAPVSHCER